MIPSGLTRHAEQFRSAIEGHDFALAQTALQDYINCFRSCPRTLPEIEDARNLLQWGIRLTTSQKAQIAEELMLLKRVFDAYRTPRRSSTWRLDG